MALKRSEREYCKVKGVLLVVMGGCMLHQQGILLYTERIALIDYVFSLSGSVGKTDSYL